MAGHVERKTRWLTFAAGLAILAVATAACTTAASPGTSGEPSQAPSGAAGQYVIGLSNNVVGNGWRDEMNCSVKVQAKKSGLVAKVVDASRNGSASDQAQDIRSLISAGVNAIVVNPADTQALNSVIAEAAAKGIVVVAVDNSVTAPEAYIVTNDQTKYGELSGDWIFKQLNGKGTVLELRGASGSSADTDRHAGFEAARANYPDIQVNSQFTDWSIAKASQILTQALASGAPVDGIFTPGTGQVVWDAYTAANKPFVPTGVSDNNGDVGGPAGDPTKIAVAVSNPAVVGGAGVTVALNVLQGKSQDKVVKLTPVAWDSTTEEGMAAMKAAYDSRLGPYYSTATEIPGYTTFTKEELLGCEGP
jgi:ribose transport system substrate-binding protein